jgi:hypothetical protein
MYAPQRRERFLEILSRKTRGFLHGCTARNMSRQDLGRPIADTKHPHAEWGCWRIILRYSYMPAELLPFPRQMGECRESVSCGSADAFPICRFPHHSTDNKTSCSGPWSHRSDQKTSCRCQRKTPKARLHSRCRRCQLLCMWRGVSMQHAVYPVSILSSLLSSCVKEQVHTHYTSFFTHVFYM